MKLTAAAIALLLTFPLSQGAIAQPAPPLLITQHLEDDWELRGLRQLEAGNFAGAIATYEQALRRAGGSSEEINTAHLGLAKATLLNQDYSRTIPLWEQIVEQRRRQGFGAEPPLTNLALALYHTGQYTQAQARLREAIAGWETVRTDSPDLDQVTFFEQQAHTYRLLQKVLVAQGKTNEALVVAEASRGQALVEQLVQQYNPSATAAPTLTLNDIRQTAQSHDTTIVLYSLVGNEVRVLGTEANLPTDLYIWVIQPTGRIGFRSVSLADSGVESLRHFVYRTRNEAVRRRSRGANVDIRLPGDTFLAQMYQLLITPIADLLPPSPTARVTFIPQDALFLLPLAALKDLQGHYLIENHTLITSPSIQVMSLTDEGENPFSGGAASPLIIGNPQMPTVPDQDSPLVDLPGAEAEAAAIAQLFNIDPLLGRQATEPIVTELSSTANILHFATHGLLDLDSRLNAYGDTVVQEQPTARDSNVFVNPGAVIVGDNVFVGGVAAEIALSREKVVRVDLPGALALTPTAGSDGFLTSEEIAQLDLTADLVVLSACDTGQGRVTGDGVVGLARSFMVAGADTVVISLWSIPDAPTAALMVTFYQRLAQHGDKARALREAMLETQQQYPHPLNWAAFALVGSPL